MEHPPESQRSTANDGPNVAVVGAGICGALAALYLSRAGYRVTLYSAGDDPRHAAGDPTRASTWAGEAPRCITLAEGVSYPGTWPESPNPAILWGRTVSGGGWLGRPFEQSGERARNWLAARIQACSDRSVMQAAAQAQLAAARRSIEEWRRLFARERSLFAAASPSSGFMPHVFTDPATLAIAAEANRAVDALNAELTPEAIARRCPVLAESCRRGTLCGGLEVSGFAINVREFSLAVLELLAHQGVRIEWNSECTGLVESDGRVRAVTVAGRAVTADNYLILPGAYSSPSLLQSLEIHTSGVAGRWLLLPCDEKATVPFKCSMRSAATPSLALREVNVMPCIDPQTHGLALAIGGGHMHVGEFPFQYDETELRVLDDALEAVARQLFPDICAVTPRERMRVRSALCVRSINAAPAPAVALRRTASEGLLVCCAGLHAAAAVLAPLLAKTIAEAIQSGDRAPMDEFSGAFRALQPASPRL